MWEDMDQAVIRHPQGSAGNKVVGVLLSRVAVVQGVNISGGTFNVLSVLGKLLAEVRSVTIPKYDEQGLMMFFLLVCYLVGQVF